MSTTEILLTQLEEYQDVPHIKVILQIFKQQQKTISEQNALIETLWAWAEEKDEAIENESERITEQENNSLASNEYDASVYTQIM